MPTFGCPFLRCTATACQLPPVALLRYYLTVAVEPLPLVTGLIVLTFCYGFTTGWDNVDRFLTAPLIAAFTLLVDAASFRGC